MAGPPESRSPSRSATAASTPRAHPRLLQRRSREQVPPALRRRCPFLRSIPRTCVIYELFPMSYYRNFIEFFRSFILSPFIDKKLNFAFIFKQRKISAPLSSSNKLDRVLRLEKAPKGLVHDKSAVLLWRHRALNDVLSSHRRVCRLVSALPLSIWRVALPLERLKSL